MRSSRDAVDRHRNEIIGNSARLFRENGVDGVSVPALMQAAGMTHGGFYKHFASKEELVPLAYADAFDQIVEGLTSIAAQHDGDAAAAWNALVAGYLSPAHRDSIGKGCAAAALAGDVARLDAGSPIRAAYQAGVERMLTLLCSLEAGPQARQQSLAALSTLIGALLLSRATTGELSDELLAAARAQLVKPSGP